MFIKKLSNPLVYDIYGEFLINILFFCFSCFLRTKTQQKQQYIRFFWEIDKTKPKTIGNMFCQTIYERIVSELMMCKEIKNKHLFGKM